jgi:hypothetical protein
MGVGETPSILTVVVVDVEKGPDWMAGMGEPPNGTFEIPQGPGPPCRFIFIDDDFNMVVTLPSGLTRFRVTNLASGVISFLGQGLPCATFYENNRTEEFAGGTATVFIPPIL